MADASMLPVSSQAAGRWSHQRAVQLLALVLAVAAAVLVLAVPLYSSATSRPGTEGEIVTTSTLLQVNGPSALQVALVVAAVHPASRRRPGADA